MWLTQKLVLGTEVVPISAGGRGELPHPSTLQRLGGPGAGRCALGSVGTGTARLSSLPSAPLALINVFKGGFLQPSCGPTAPANKHCASGDPAQLPCLNGSAQQAQSSARFFRQFPLLRGRECPVALCFLLTFFQHISDLTRM